MTPSSSSDLPQFTSASQTSGIEAAFNKLRLTSPSDSSGATTEASAPKALLAAHDGAFIADHAAAMRYASDWHIPEASRVPFSEIPEILISLFGTFRRDCVSNTVPDAASHTEADNEAKYDDDVSQPISANDHAVGEARLFYSSRVDAPFEVFAVKWSGEEIRWDGTIDNDDHDRESDGEGDPMSRNTSGSSGSTGSDDSEHERKAHSDDHTQRKRVSPITKIAKHLPGQHAHKHNGPLTPRHKQHNPSAKTFRSLIKLPPDSPLRSIAPEEWDPKGAYGNILVSVSAATGSPVKIYQAGGGQGRIWYWIVGRLVGHDVLVGVSTFAVFGTYHGEAGDNDGTNEGGRKMVVTAFNDNHATPLEQAVHEEVSVPTEKQLRERRLQGL
ncbi:hypothetical protein V1520DRAFT_184060 [Lipomyces starkeyi]|uniref:Uncharacterized protein n=1 Tax=Lipomyces starkeyi NRRL Y-11557 TaxID=675824 RepID=A0A1E3Q773_LIPST|nr:hypothetical protein LIPSTDRAFT_3346 [Lipomyces starkeyi NRRL Y-11557]